MSCLVGCLTVRLARQSARAHDIITQSPAFGRTYSVPRQSQQLIRNYFKDIYVFELCCRSYQGSSVQKFGILQILGHVDNERHARRSL